MEDKNSLSNYSLLDLNKQKLSIFTDCFSLNDNPKNIERIRWQYFNNPTNNSVVKIAFDHNNQRTAAIYAISCSICNVEGNVVTASQSMDTITDNNYRGKGLFVSLAKKVYEDAKKEDIKFVYGFPNGKSVHGFLKHLNWKLLDPVPFLIKPLRSKYFLKKIKPFYLLPDIKLTWNYTPNKYRNYRISENLAIPEDIDEVWNKFSKNFKIAVVRNKEYLIWRYIDKPNEHYRIAHCYYDDKYLGLVIFVNKQKHNGNIGYLMELIFNTDYPDAANLLLKYASSELSKSKADCILTWAFEHSPNYSIFKKNFYLKMPERLRPIELHFGVCSLDEKFDDIISRRENWYISYSDSDTV